MGANKNPCSISDIYDSAILEYGFFDGNLKITAV